MKGHSEMASQLSTLYHVGHKSYECNSSVTSSIKKTFKHTLLVLHS